MLDAKSRMSRSGCLKKDQRLLSSIPNLTRSSGLGLCLSVARYGSDSGVVIDHRSRVLDFGHSVFDIV